MTTLLNKLLKRAEELEARAQALRTAAAEMNGHAITKKQASGVEQTMAKAIELRAKTPRKHYPSDGRPRHQPTGKHTKKVEAARRTRTARILTRMADKGEPVPAGFIGRATGTLINNGYIKKQGDGYVRTDKVFTP